MRDQWTVKNKQTINFLERHHNNQQQQQQQNLNQIASPYQYQEQSEQDTNSPCYTHRLLDTNAMAKTAAFRLGIFLEWTFIFGPGEGFKLLSDVFNVKLLP